jgi:tartrate dehydrogenase/decarboxylase/D-malate dehydrogenase
MAESKDFSIALIPGDGVGLEVMPEARRVLDHISEHRNVRFRFTEFDWGTSYYFEHGRMMPAGGLDQLRSFDAILLGAVGHPDVPDHTTLNGLLLPIRRAFDQWACERPVKLYAGVRSPLAGKEPDSIDMVVVRENAEGEYSQVGGILYGHTPHEVAVQTAVFTRRGVERIIRHAFELARRRNGKKRVTSITKSNAQGYSMVLWDRTFSEAAHEYPDIATESLLVDAAAMNFVRRPESFDVVVGSNLFGDILSDLSAIITGSLGLAPSSNLNPSREFPSMFEPVHGSAPDIAGQGIVNPLAMINSSAMMLDFLGLPGVAAEIEDAVQAVLAEGAALTPDLGGKARTTEVTEALLRKMG